MRRKESVVQAVSFSKATHICAIMEMALVCASGRIHKKKYSAPSSSRNCLHKYYKYFTYLVKCWIILQQHWGFLSFVGQVYFHLYNSCYCVLSSAKFANTPLTQRETPVDSAKCRTQLYTLFCKLKKYKWKRM